MATEISSKLRFHRQQEKKYPNRLGFPLTKDDPAQTRVNVTRGEREVLKKLAPASENPDTDHPSLTKEKVLSALLEGELQAEATKELLKPGNDFNLSRLVFMQKKIVEPIREELQQALLDFDNQENLKASVELTFDDNDDANYISFKGHDVEILPQTFVNPITYWYINTTFADPISAIDRLRLNEYETDVFDRMIKYVIILGWVYGFFNDTHPRAEEYKQVFAPLVKSDFPQLIKDIMRKVEKEGNVSPRLRLLKKFWHQAFIAEWVATARLEYDNIQALTPVDRLTAQQQLGADLRSADTRSGASSQAENAYHKWQKDSHLTDIVQEYDNMSARLAAQAKAAHNRVLKHTGTIIKAYNPEHRLLVDERGRPGGDWLILKNKSGFIFDTLVRNAKDLVHPHLSYLQQQEILATTATQLVAVLHRGETRQQLDPSVLFGPEFYSLAPIEQICLITFTCLALSGRRGKPEKAVHLISAKLQSLLAQHEDITIEPKETLYSDPGIPDSQAFNQIEVIARRQMSRLSPSDEVVSSANTALEAELEDRYSLLSIFDRALRKPGLPTRLLLAGATSYTLGSLGFLLSVELVGTKSSPVTPYELFTLLSALPLIALRLKQIRAISANEALQEYLPQLEILNDTVTDEIGKLNISIERKQQLEVRKQLIYLLILFLIFPVLVSTATIYSEVTSRNQGTSLFAGRAPDILDPDRLGEVDFQEVGTLLHLPEGFDASHGATLGFLPSYWQQSAEQGMQVITLGQFGNTEYVEDINQFEFEFAPNQLAFQLDRPTSLINPLTGYHIVQIIQVGGSPPQLTNLGVITYDTRPEAQIVVYEPNQSAYEAIHDPVQDIEYAQGNDYTRQLLATWDNTYQQALELNSQLTGDTSLLLLHHEMVSSAHQLVEQFRQQELDLEAFTREFDQLGREYAERFVEYSRAARYYSLRYPLEMWQGNDFLVDLGRNPLLAYYCSVADMAQAEFLNSIGLATFSQFGVNIQTFNGTIMSRFGHIKTTVMLPSGALLSSDATPTRPNPGEDLSVLDGLPPEGFPDLSEAARNSSVFLASLALLLLAGKGIEITKNLIKKRKRALEFKIDGYLPQEQLPKNQVFWAVEHGLTYLLDLADPEKAPNLISDDFEIGRDAYLETLVSDMMGFLEKSSIKLQTPLTIRRVLLGQTAAFKKQTPDLDLSVNSQTRLSALSVKLTQEQRGAFHQQVKALRAQFKHRATQQLQLLAQEAQASGMDPKTRKQELRKSVEKYNATIKVLRLFERVSR